ncbi:MAG: adenosine kinase, partial [Gemmatimonadales bacterium]
YILVTPDGERTMNTYLGAAQELMPDDIDAAQVAASRILYLEGYLWDPPAAKDAFLKAAEVAHGAGRKVALSLSDGFCVERHRAEFRQLLGRQVDILFANEKEIRSLWEVEDFDQALQATKGVCELAALTRSARGSVILAGGDVHVADAAPVDRLVDTTGAGALYAAGFLFGYTRGLPAYYCARIGAIAAAEVISHFGARPETPLADLLPKALAPVEAHP